MTIKLIEKNSKFSDKISKYRIFISIPILLTMTDCDEIKGGLCHGTSAISAHDLAESAISRLVKETQGPLPHIVKYTDSTEFHLNNPSCCFVQKPVNYSGGLIKIPMESQVSLAIIYKKTEDANYRTVRYVDFGECSTEMDHTERNIPYSQFNITKWGWRIK